MASGTLTRISQIEYAPETLGYDLITTARDMPDRGIRCYSSSNTPTNHAPNNNWGGYIIFKINSNHAVFISLGDSLQYATGSLSTMTSLNWKNAYTP